MVGRLGTYPEEMDTPLRKRLADLEKRRQTLIDAMSKYQDAKRSALFQYLNENQLEDQPPSLSWNMYRDDVFSESKEDRDCSTMESTRDGGTSERDTSAPIIQKYKETSKSVLPMPGSGSAPIDSARNIGSSDGDPSTRPVIRQKTSSLSSADPSARNLVFSRMTMEENVQNIVSPNTLRREQRSLVLAAKRTSYRKRQYDEDPTQSVETLPPRTNSDDSAKDKNVLGKKDTPSDDFLGDSDAPSDEVVKQGMKVEDNIASELPKEQKTTPQETLKKPLVSTSLSLPAKKEETKYSFTEWKKKSIASRKSKNEKAKHPIIARLRELKESKTITISKIEENEKRSKLFNRLDEIIEDVDSRQAKNEIRENHNRTLRDKRGQHQIEERFLKLFVDDEVCATQNKGDAETNSSKTGHTSNVSQRLTSRTKDDPRLGNRTQIPKENAKKIAAPAKNDGSGDHMALLEAKLNMMISRKPLWQKALQDLYDEPIDRKISASTSSSSRTTKPLSDAETVSCSSNPTLNQNASKSSMDSNIGTSVISERNQRKNVPNDLDPEGVKDAMDSQSSIENAKEYLNNLPECLSGLYEKSSDERSSDEKGIDENHIVRRGEEEVHSADEQQQRLSNIATESNESYETEEDDPREWEVEDIIVEYVERDHNDMTYQTTNSSCSSSIKPLDDVEQMSSNYEDKRQYELMAVSNYTEDEQLDYVSSESTEQSVDVGMDSQSITVIEDCSTPSNEGQVTQEFTESYGESYDEIDVHRQPYEQIDANESYNKNDIEGERQNIRYNEEQDIAKTHLHSNQSEISTAAVFKTSPMANGDQQFVSGMHGKNRHSKDSIFSDMVSKLNEENATLSLQVSSSNSMDKVDFRSGNLGSELSSQKSSVPNEVTMQTDFTVQSVTYEPNASYVESLGQESVVRQARKSRHFSERNMFSSNSESTIVAESRKRGRKETILQVDKPNASCSKNLLSAICQCTGPVVLTDVDMCEPKRGNTN